MSIRKVEMKDASDPLSAYATEVGDSKSPVVVTAAGRAIAAVIPVDDADLETMSLSANPRFIRIIEESRASLAREGGIPSDELRLKLGLPRRSSRRRS